MIMVVAYVSQLPNESTYSLGISYLRTVACSDVYHTMWDESSDCESEFPTNKIVHNMMVQPKTQNPY